MKNPTQSAWSRSTGWAAAAVALAATLAVAPSMARAACVGDCNGDGNVTVNELIIMVNIALGSASVSVCPAGDPNNDGQVTVNEIVAGVNNSLNGCPVNGVCGDGTIDANEQCDPGSICIGGTNAGTSCKAEADCQGEGVCDTFGVKGPPGTVPRKVCTDSSECGGAMCIHCKPFSNNGCSANCTLETPSIITLVPGVLVGSDITPGTSGAIVHGDILTIPLTLAGTNTLLAGKADANNNVHIAQTPSGVNLQRIPVSTIACACVRGSIYKTCGGTQFEADGKTPSTNCTVPLCSVTKTTQCAVDGDCPSGETCVVDPCAGKKPCTAVAGPGNSGEGAIGCTSLPSVNYTVTQDSGGSTGIAGPAIFTPGAGGGAGSQVNATASAIGTVVGLCTGTAPDYGPDGEFCTDDDPLSARGVPSIQTLVTGTATASLTNANGIDDNNVGPFSSTGNAVTCDQIAAGHLTGGAQAGAFDSLNQPTTGDIVVTNIFISQ